MSQNSKPQCAACLIKEGIILYQRFVIKQQKAEISELKRRIASAQKTAATIQEKADKVMSEHQPRGTWSYFKGGKLAAQAISRALAGYGFG